MKYDMLPYERILSDHYDFVALESFAGFCDGIETYLKMTGLSMSDEDRCRDNDGHRSRGKKDVVWISVRPFDRLLARPPQMSTRNHEPVPTGGDLLT